MSKQGSPFWGSVFWIVEGTFVKHPILLPLCRRELAAGEQVRHWICQLQAVIAGVTEGSVRSATSAHAPHM